MGLAGRRIGPCYLGLQRFPEKGIRFKAIARGSLYVLAVQLWTKTKYVFYVSSSTLLEYSIIQFLSQI